MSPDHTTPGGVSGECKKARFHLCRALLGRGGTYRLRGGNPPRTPPEAGGFGLEHHDQSPSRNEVTPHPSPQPASTPKITLRLRLPDPWTDSLFGERAEMALPRGKQGKIGRLGPFSPDFESALSPGRIRGYVDAVHVREARRARTHTPGVPGPPESTKI
jgi:hypothetical protein